MSHASGCRLQLIEESLVVLQLSVVVEELAGEEYVAFERWYQYAVTLS
jgi:hypothetical protein